MRRTVHMEEQMEITIGGLARPMHEQLGCSEEKARKWQKIHDAIILLKVQGIFTDTETNQASRKLVKMIEREFK